LPRDTAIAQFHGRPVRNGVKPSAISVRDPGNKRSSATNALRIHVSIIASEDDRLIDVDKQSARLHSDVPQRAFHRVA
jgi:pimeloyl-ACP methyl ester carboxylesterase